MPAKIATLGEVVRSNRIAMVLMLVAVAMSITSDGFALAAGARPEWLMSSLLLTAAIVAFQQLRRSQALMAVHGADHVSTPQPRAGRVVLGVVVLILGAGVFACAWRYSADADPQAAFRPLILALTCAMGVFAVLNVFRKPVA